MKLLRRLILILLALIAGGIAVYESWIRIPPNFLPWGTVVLDAKPGWFANIQLNGLSADGNACRAALGRSTLKFSVMADRKIGENAASPMWCARIRRRSPSARNRSRPAA